LPPAQESLEAAYRSELGDAYGGAVQVESSLPITHNL
jgi:hypothetical protein